MAIIIDSNDCIGCGQCDDHFRDATKMVSPGSGAIKFHSTSGYARAYINQDVCTGCKLCLTMLDCPGECFHEVKP